MLQPENELALTEIKKMAKYTKTKIFSVQDAITNPCTEEYDRHPLEHTPMLGVFLSDSQRALLADVKNIFVSSDECFDMITKLSEKNISILDQLLEKIKNVNKVTFEQAKAMTDKYIKPKDEAEKEFSALF
jgi:hypothetical protein